MINFTNTDYIPKEKTACALGLFDGVHTGHRLIIGEAVSSAREMGGKAAVFCFKTDTVTSKGHDGRIEMLMSDTEKQKKMAYIGVDYIYSPDFEYLKSMSPEDFVKEILADKLNCSAAVCGEDFTFGKGAKGKAEDLKRIGAKYGIKTKIISPLTLDGEVISSTEIRRCIREGNIVKANKMLGEPFSFELPVEHGFKRGHSLGFPTINQQIPEGRVMPRFGVYASKVFIDGSEYFGVTNIGVKPTVEENIKRPIAETNIIGFDGSLYGRVLKLQILKFVREEKKFPSIEKLKSQIGKDKEFAENYFNNKQ